MSKLDDVAQQIPPKHTEYEEELARQYGFNSVAEWYDALDQEIEALENYAYSH